MTDAGLNKERTEALRIAMQSLAVVAKYCGVTLDEAQQELQDGYLAVEEPGGLDEGRQAVRSADVSFLAKMLQEWRSQATYVDSRGEPMRLPLEGGPTSVRSIYEAVERAWPTGKTRIGFGEAVKTLTRHKAIRKDEDGLYQQLMVFFRAPSEGSDANLMQLTYAAEFLETIAHNTRSRETGGRFVAVARSSPYPSEKVKMVSAMLWEDGMTFIQGIDEQIEHDKLTDVSSENGTMVGVGMYSIQRDWGWR